MIYCNKNGRENALLGFMAEYPCDPALPRPTTNNDKMQRRLLKLSISLALRRTYPTRRGEKPKRKVI